MIDLECHSCGTKLSVPDSFAGKEHVCPNPNCDKMIKVLINPDAAPPTVERQRLGEQRSENEPPPGQVMRGVLMFIGTTAAFVGGGCFIASVVMMNLRLAYVGIAFLVWAIFPFFAWSVLANLIRITKAVEEKKDF